MATTRQAIAHLERMQRRGKPKARQVMAYFIGAETGPVKIGQTTDIRRRLSALQVASPVRLTLLAVCRGGCQERMYHSQFAHSRLHGEWFERTPEIEAEIARLNRRHCHAE